MLSIVTTVLVEGIDLVPALLVLAYHDGGHDGHDDHDCGRDAFHGDDGDEDDNYSGGGGAA